ncbi:MAG: hypothetical protein A3F84_06630 [Candidatus Handelsmanbacteria bacterium RIFCSPLOWO2_12_FULL_64_10]|uniref:DUF3306 domain-containing protein n=1 Tax=Handelsmanbacteria sp. (strain RIFCSPLOWO2_12_FULL_64_10) TaxID=1817868 RepID=A0A1F6D4D6_HANXR|nr:MAG: hypothetical protein A3F84_06630 [Candidatus Handelsmanbacteria bacterium RIFCSPLOWO2_12_FULL_64_10]
MAAEHFFRRWSKPANTPATDAAAPPAAVIPSAEVKTGSKLLPSMADVAGLTPESDYSGFLATGVDEAVKRSALKKLFTDPHFNIMDGLDIYVGDYSQPDPMPAGMLAALNHAQALLNPLEQFESALPVAVQPAPDQSSPVQVADAATFSGAPSDQSADEQEPTAAASDGGETSPEITKDRA